MQAPETRSKTENPLTREKVQHLIEEHTGPDGLDLSGKEFIEGVNLSGLDMRGINFSNARFPARSTLGAQFENAKLEGASFKEATLHYANYKKAEFWNVRDQRGADLSGAEIWNADFRGTGLWSVDLRGASLLWAKLEKADLQGTPYLDELDLEQVDWGNYVLAGEAGLPGTVEGVYRSLKAYYTQHGLPDVAAKFYYREMECRRKALSWRTAFWSKLWHTFLRMAVGYGEHPERVVFFWTLPWLLGLAGIYFTFSGVTGADLAERWWRSLHFSAVSFTAVGYGSWWDKIDVQPWAQGFGVAESFLGVFTMALFVTLFIRKMSR
ncbi:MAG TPA: pentapeptide repeat-containing protein [Dehalococcoidia bacterium]|nr:pentapeptide repeat-containing protein [Dehalococcoidia bacterium]